MHGSVKGIRTAEDARLAIDCGVNGVLVSTHGGRQMDATLSSIESLPEVVEVCAGRAEVYLDSGVRRGSDVLKALALGAKATLIARPYLYGLAVGGAEGATRVLELLRREIRTAMALAGRPTVASIDRTLVKRET